MHRIQTRLKHEASKTNTALWIIEKDYAISYLLAALFKVPLLSKQLVLKGGTALKKAYFKDYRFSEDLDFSALHESNQEAIRENIDIAINIMQQDLQERGPFAILSEPLILRKIHPGNQIAYTIRVQYPYQRSPLCRLKVEITIDEPILLPPQIKPILHGYEETLETKIMVYQLSEIVTEKYRALLQSLDKLHEKGWGANRVCRDYYDLWSILTSVDFSDHNIPAQLKEKCLVRNVTLKNIEMFFDNSLLKVAENEWNKLLIPFVPHPIPLEKIISELQPLTQAIFN